MSISRCASLFGLAAIVALAILTNVSSLFEYKTKVQVHMHIIVVTADITITITIITTPIISPTADINIEIVIPTSDFTIAITRKYEYVLSGPGG